MFRAATFAKLSPFSFRFRVVFVAPVDLCSLQRECRCRVHQSRADSRRSALRAIRVRWVKTRPDLACGSIPRMLFEPGRVANRSGDAVRRSFSRSPVVCVRRVRRGVRYREEDDYYWVLKINCMQHNRRQSKQLSAAVRRCWVLGCVDVSERGGGFGERVSFVFLLHLGRKSPRAFLSGW